MDSREATLDELLEHRGWVRALARTLVAGDARADDVEQDAWLAALRRPPRVRGSLRAWFAAVVRSRARDRRRTDVRRIERETAAARRESTASAADVAATTEIHRNLAAALLELDEPCRSAVILRYFEDLPPRVVAARTGVPVETARTRIKRGVERLRERLDARHGGDRRTWLALVAPLAFGRTAKATLGGGTIVAAKKSAALAALLLLAFGAGVAAWISARSDASSAAAAGASAAAADVVRPTRPARRAPSADSAAPTSAPTQVDSDPTSDRPLVAVVDAETKKPLAGAQVVVVQGDTWRQWRDGAATPAPLALDADLTGKTATLWASAPGHTRRRVPDVTLTAGPLAIELASALPVELTFVSESGRRLDAAQVRARFGGAIPYGKIELVADDAFSAADVPRTLRRLFGPAADWRLPAAVDGDDASLRLADGVGPGRWRLFVERPGATAWLSAPFDGGDAASISIPLPDAPRTRRVRLVADDTRAPLADASLASWYPFGENAAPLPGEGSRTDAQGVASLPYDPPETRGDEPRPIWCVRAPGRAAAVDAWRAIDAAPDVDPVEVSVAKSVVVLGEACLPSGAPAAGRRVVTADVGMSWGAVVAADGSFRIDDAPTHDGAVDLILYAVDSVAQARAGAGDDGVARVVIGAKSAPTTRGRIAGRVTVGGSPLVGAFVCDQPSDTKGSFVRTDAAGRFVLDGLDVALARDLVVYLGDPQADDSRCRVRTTSPLRLDAAKPLEFEFDLPSGAIRAKVVDADSGAPVAGAAVLARPADESFDRARFAGFDYVAGWADFTDADGAALLRALPTGTPYVIGAQAAGYEPGERDGAAPGTSQAPGEVVLRLAKKR